MHIDRATVQHLATLCRLELEPDEEEKFLAQLPGILEYVGRLQSVAPDHVPPLAAPNNEWRPDATEPSGLQAQVLQQAPEQSGPFWKVPPVL